MTTSLLLWASAAVIFFTSALHSALGESRLISPLLRAGDGVLASSLARRVLRLAWHFTSILMVLTAALLILVESRIMVLAIGVTYAVVGLLDCMLTRGRHVGWLPLTLAGVLALIAAA